MANVHSPNGGTRDDDGWYHPSGQEVMCAGADDVLLRWVSHDLNSGNTAMRKSSTNVLEARCGSSSTR